MYKLSNYLVNVNFKNQKHQKNQALVFSTRQASLKIMDQTVWERLKHGKIESFDQETIDQFLKANILVDGDEDECLTILKQNKEYIDQSTHLYMVIQPTAACPLGCGYCGQVHSSKKMSSLNQQLTLRHIEDKLATGKYKSMNIGWFGAEPLSGIDVIIKLSKEINKLVQKYNIQYWSKIITNGLLINPKIAHDLINDYGVRDIEITLDGDRDFHDKRRHTKAFTATFDRIYTNILDIVDIPGANITIRSNVDGSNREGVSPLLHRLKRDGLHQKIKHYVAPIHSWGNEAHEQAAEKKDFADWEIDWLVEKQELGFKLSYLPQRTHSVCFAVHPDQELIDPFGGIYGCSEVSLVPSYVKEGRNIHELGHVSEQKLNNQEQRQVFGSFYETSHLEKYPCYTCPMLPTCGGGCPKEWSEGRMACPPTKFNIDKRLVLSYLANTHQENTL